MPQENLSGMLRCCPICQCDNRDTPAHLYSRMPWNIKVCKKCGFIYLENPPKYEALSDELAWEKTWEAESIRRKTIHPTLKSLARSFRGILNHPLKKKKLIKHILRYVQPGSILDVGCCGGHALEQLPAQFTPYGIEVSNELGRQANERYSARGGQAVTGAAISMTGHFAAGFFSGVIMSSFLEHEADVLGVLAAARHVMRPSARLIIKVPNFSCWNRSVTGKNWCGFRFPEHVNYFTPGMLRKALRVSGFHILRFGVLDRFPTSDTMWCIAERA